MRHSANQPLASARAAAKPGHIRLGPGLVDEYKLSRVQLWLLATPFGARFGNVRTVLLGSMERLFLNVRSSVASVFHIRPVLAETLWVSDSHACNSAIVASGRVFTWASIAPCKAASRRGRWPR